MRVESCCDRRGRSSGLGPRGGGEGVGAGGIEGGRGRRWGSQRSWRVATPAPAECHFFTAARTGAERRQRRQVGFYFLFFLRFFYGVYLPGPTAACWPQLSVDFFALELWSVILRSRFFSPWNSLPSFFCLLGRFNFGWLDEFDVGGPAPHAQPSIRA